jgi:hypothetical protein
MRSRGRIRSGEYCSELPSFFQNSGNCLGVHEPRFLQQLQPKNCLVCLFNHNSYFSCEFLFRPAATSRTIVGCDRGPASDQLFSEHISVCTIRKHSVEAQYLQCELLGTIPEFLLSGRHNRVSITRFRNYPITRSVAVIRLTYSKYVATVVSVSHIFTSFTFTRPLVLSSSRTLISS